MENRSQIKDELSKRMIQFTLRIIRLAEKYQANRALSPVFNQLIRSGSSIGANVTEAQGSASRKDFKNYFHIALKSAKETNYWLLVLLEYGGDIALDAKQLQNENTQFIKILTSSILTIKSKI